MELSTVNLVRSMLAVAMLAMLCCQSHADVPHRVLPRSGVISTFDNALADGWRVGDADFAAIARDADNVLLRITNDDPNVDRSLTQRYAIPDGATEVAVSVRMRAPTLVRGDLVWQNARVQLQFVDDSDARVGNWPEVPDLNDATDKWVQRRVTVPVPAGGKYLKLNVGLFHATGIAEFDDLRVEPLFPAALPEGVDLIGGDGGFERGEADAKWHYNNWAANEVEFTRDDVQPRSGTWSLRIDQRRQNQGRDVQLIYPLSDFKGGERVELTFWVRGPENAPPIGVALQKRGAPYTQYGAKRVALNDQWTQKSFILTLPRTALPEEIGLYFYVRGEQTVWIDDVSITGLAPQAGGEALVGNQVVNGSFEVGLERWSVDLQGRRGLDEEVRKDATNADFAPAVVQSEDAPTGRRVLRIDVNEPGRVVLSSAFFDLRYGHPAVLSFWLRTGEPGLAVRAQVGHGSLGTFAAQGETFRNDATRWQQHAYRFTPEPSTGGTYLVVLSLSEPGTYWIDGVAANEGDRPDLQPRRPSAGVEPVSPVPGNLYVSGEAVSVRIRLDSPTPKQLVGHVIDAWGERVGADINVAASSDEPAVLDLPRHRHGPMKLVLRESDVDADQRPAVEWQYMVLPKLPPPSVSTDRFFGGHGGHGGLTPAHLQVAERVGLRGIRAHPPWNTKWTVVEPEEGKFDFPTDGIRRASEAGFKIVGSFDWTPEWAADRPEHLHKSWRGTGHLPPKDWALWRRYVTETAKAFSPWIHDWEIWNEPDLPHWLHPVFGSHGKTQAELYLRFVDETRRALDDAGIDVTLAGGALARAEDPLMDTLLEAGLASRVDAVSFHLYGSKPLQLRPLVSRLSHMKGRSGKPLEIWQSEGAFNVPSLTWLRTLRIPEALPETIPAQTAGFAQQLVILKAIGVDRNFHYPAPNANRFGRMMYRNDFAYGDDPVGNPLPLWAGHAAAVRMLDEAYPVGDEPLRHITVDDHPYWVATFERAGKRVWVAWAADDSAVAASKLGVPADTKAFDMFANPIGSAESTRVDWRPVYFTE